MQHRLTRQQLHSLVWSRPITHLARDFGLSDVALHKICRKHRVPTPPPGYWAKKAYGKKTSVSPLLDLHDASEILIREGSASNEPEAMIEARASVIAALAVSPAPTAGNPIIERTLTKVSKAKARADGLIRIMEPGLVKVVVRPETVERVRDLLPELGAAAAKAGIGLIRGKTAAEWSCEGETVAFEVVEAADKIEHAATEKEIAAVAKWKRDREDRHRRGYWDDWGEPKIPKWEYRHRGRLMVRLENVRLKTENSHWGEPIRHSFAETHARRINKSVPAIFSTIAAMAQAKRSNAAFEALEREAAAERARRWAEEERRRLAEARAIQILDKLVEEQAAVNRLRALLDALTRQELDFRGRRLLKCVEARFTTMEKQLGSEVLEQRLTAADLFGPID